MQTLMSALRLIPRIDDELDTRNPLIISIDDVLTADECAELITRIETIGPEAAPITTHRGFEMRPDIRNNGRVMFDDLALAQTLCDRVRAQVPERLEDEWVLSGANERLRCYRYLPGQYFAPHFDGAFRRSLEERSLLTFMVYLNDVEAGGTTNFNDLELSYTPRRGSALLFNHHLRHEGAEVQSGVKYAVRSDLMYRRVKRGSPSP